MMELMHAVRALAAVSYCVVDDATILHVSHTGSFKIPRAIRHFCLRACLHMHGPGTGKVHVVWLNLYNQEFLLQC